MTDRGPLSIGEARAKSAKHSEAQENAERFRVQAARDLAEKERAYRSELAQEIVRQHADGVAWSTASDVSRGQKRVADLRYDRDVARGVLDAAAEAAYRHAADRRAYRKKPVVIEATQWHRNGDHPEDHPDGRPKEHEGLVVRYFRRPDVSGSTPCRECGVPMHDHGWIDTLEAGHNVCPGDWIITGVKGERYPCKPDIFEATYEAVA